MKLYSLIEAKYLIQTKITIDMNSIAKLLGYTGDYHRVDFNDDYLCVGSVENTFSYELIDRKEGNKNI